VHSEEALYEVYQKFEADRIKKAEAQLNGAIKLKPDSFAKFVVERTDICPHRVIQANSMYWLDTIALLDGEMGLNLPCVLDECPAVFFDCLGIVRSMRGKVRKEETKT
jgi:hypothetical protein